MAVSLEKACLDFMADADSRELEKPALRKCRQLAKRMRVFDAEERLLLVGQWDVEAVRRFRLSRKDQGLTVVKKLERPRAFFLSAIGGYRGRL